MNSSLNGLYFEKRDWRSLLFSALGALFVLCIIIATPTAAAQDAAVDDVAAHRLSRKAMQC